MIVRRCILAVLMLVGFGWGQAPLRLGDLDQRTPSYPGGQRSAQALRLGAVLVFPAGVADVETGCELWATDGTSAGTRLLGDLNPGAASSDPSLLCVWGGGLFFSADDGVHGSELWVTDGTPAGTRLVRDIVPGEAGSFPRDMQELGDRLLFVADGHELWATDGTEEGSRLVYDHGSEGILRMEALSNGRVFYLTGHGEEWALYSSDGTEAGTSFLYECAVGSNYYDLASVVAFAGRVFFLAWPCRPNEPDGLWTTDGTPEGTSFFCHAMLANTPNDTGRYLCVCGEKLYFAGFDSAYGDALWATDGTEEGTHLVRDLVPGEGNSAPAFLACAGAHALFTADTGGFSREVWTTDGTESGTVPLSGMFGQWQPLLSDGDEVYLASIFSTEYGRSYNSLWATDGTPTGTRRLDAGSFTMLDPKLVPFGGSKYFCAYLEYDLGLELCAVDEGGAGIGVVQDIVPGWHWSGCRILGALDNALVFSADDGLRGHELWAYDGTTGGAACIADIVTDPGINLGAEPWIKVAGNAAYLWCRTTNALWKADGTPEGTRNLGEYLQYDRDMVAVMPDGALLFRVRNSQGWWSPMYTDGTVEGTRSLDTAFGAGGSRLFLEDALVLGTHVLLAEWDYALDYPVLWVLDRTNGEARRLGDVALAVDGSLDFFDAPWAAVLAGSVFFKGFDAAHGGELWVSDGTPEGTYSLLEHAAVRYSPHYFPEFPQPPIFLPARRFLLFSGDDGRTGAEPWALFLPPAPTSNFSLTPEGCQAGRRVVADASLATTPEGSAIVGYSWDMGDGTVLTGKRVEHTYGPNAYGARRIRLTVANDAGLTAACAKEFCIRSRFVRGDANASATTDIADAIFLLSHLFAKGPAPSCKDAGDTNDDDTIDIADAIALLSHLFAHAGPLPSPFGECGVEPESDALGCLRYVPCE